MITINNKIYVKKIVIDGNFFIKYLSLYITNFDCFRKEIKAIAYTLINNLIPVKNKII